MKGENDEGEISIDGMTVWVEHLYLPAGIYRMSQKNVYCENTLLKLLLLQFLRKQKVCFGSRKCKSKKLIGKYGLFRFYGSQCKPT